MESSKPEARSGDLNAGQLAGCIATVLLVDDQPLVGHAVRNMLANETDVNLHYCQDPAHALQLAEELSPTVILLDLVMPTMNGLDLVRHLRDNPTTVDTPIIVLCRPEEASTKGDVFAAGANDYLVKFPDKVELISRVRYHSTAHLNRIQRDEAYRAFQETQQKLVESTTRLHASNRELEAATKVKSQFLASLSHEIRTPLSGVIGMTTLLADTPLTKEQTGYVETIRSSGRALLDLINDILDFSKVEAGQVGIDEQPFDLVSCVEDTLDSLAMKACEKDLALSYKIEPGVPRQLFGDVARIRQILVNLIGNALKFTPQGEVSVRIFRPVAGEAMIQFSVRDTGIGIPRDRHHRLFKSFSQVDRPSPQNGGTGVGLAICKILCEKMGGRIWVDSDSNSGSTFHFTLMLRAAASDSVEEQVALRPPANLSGKRVLIVEDKVTHLETLKQKAKNLGMIPGGVGNGGAVLQLMNGGARFDAVVVNSRVRDVEVLELTRQIRSASGGTSMRLILMAPMDLNRLCEQAQESGVSAILYEPVRDLQFREVFQSVFDAKQETNQTTALEDGNLGSRFPLRILLAEDNRVNQRVALSFLNKLGYSAEIVENGRQVISSLERQTYDVVLMDVMMPDMDGDEATRQICQRWSPQERPRIIAMTANAMQGDREKCLSAGMDDYLSKPVSLKTLEETLERWARTVHAQR